MTSPNRNVGSRRRVLFVFGTRPEALKCFPVARDALAHPLLEARICLTAQHREMLDQVMTLTGLPVDFDLNVMRPGQSLFDVTTRVLDGLREVLEAARPDIVVVQGDTTTAMAGALAAFYSRIPVAHIEAGLRSGDIQSPFPEELNRRIVGDIARWHFAPTQQARDSLLAEGKTPASVFVTGNTGIDTLTHFSSVIDADRGLQRELARHFAFLDPARKLVLVTTHRRENVDGGMERICTALAALARRDDVQVVLPVHPNPKVQAIVRPMLGAQPNVFLIDNQEYLPFLYLMKRSHLVLTDSGGLQEEAPALGKPVLVLRENTERPDGVLAGVAALVGTDPQTILDATTRLLEDAAVYRGMAQGRNPYGDGHAAARIVEELAR